jgi:hypothetical protein
MQFILSTYNEEHPDSNLGRLSSCLIPESGHKHLYTMTKKDMDGLHKDKFHRSAPSSFTVSLQRFYLYHFGYKLCSELSSYQFSSPVNLNLVEK